MPAANEDRRMGNVVYLQPKSSAQRKQSCPDRPCVVATLPVTNDAHMHYLIDKLGLDPRLHDLFERRDG